jgi:hypothetical protein
VIPFDRSLVCVEVRTDAGTKSFVSLQHWAVRCSSVDSSST